jgi:N-acylglucosamine 2-epimerase
MVMAARCGGDGGSGQTTLSDPVAEQYRSILFDDIIPFWEAHGFDGPDDIVHACLDADGSPVCDTVTVEALGQALWTYSTLCTRYGERPQWRAHADALQAFLIRNALGKQFEWAYRLDRSGTVVEGPVSIWSDSWAALGLFEYAVLSGNQFAHEIATDTMARIFSRTSATAFDAVKPGWLEGRLTHLGIAHIRLLLVEKLLGWRYADSLDGIRRKTTLTVMKGHLDRSDDLLYQYVTYQGEHPEGPAGRCIQPGTALNVLTELMLMAHRTTEKELTAETARLVERHLAFGWDDANGGLRYALDSDGVPMDMAGQPSGDLRSRADHASALGVAYLAHELTGAPWCGEWFSRLHDYALDHFASGPGRDWHPWLDASGAPAPHPVEPPVRDMFHVPNLCLRIIEMSDISDHALTL